MNFQERSILGGVFGTLVGGCTALSAIKNYGDVVGAIVGPVVMLTTWGLLEGGYRLIDRSLYKRRVSKSNQENMTLI